jgi:hypothetical protein
MSQTNITIWGGYSYLNGIVGAEAQYGKFGIGAGYFPIHIITSNNYVSSFSASISYYMKNNQHLIYPYGSIGVASAGYHSNDIIDLMTIGMIGIKSSYNNWQLKTGLGYGWCQYENKLMFEIGINRILFSNN